MSKEYIKFRDPKECDGCTHYKGKFDMIGHSMPATTMVCEVDSKQTGCDSFELTRFEALKRFLGMR